MMKYCKSKFILPVILLMNIFFLLSCGGGVVPSKTVRYPQDVSPEMKQQFDIANGMYLRRQFDEAYVRFQEFIDGHGYNKLADESYYKQGKIDLIKGDFVRAIERFNHLAKRSPDPAYRAKGYFMVGFSYYKNKSFEQALVNFKESNGDLLPVKLRIQMYSLIIYSSQVSNIDKEYADFAKLRLYDLYDESSVQMRLLRSPDLISYDSIKKMVEMWVKEPMDLGSVPGWMKKYPQGPAKAFVDFKYAKMYYDAQNDKKAREYLTVFLQNYPKNQFVQVAQNMLQELGGVDSRFKVKKFKLGVLVPLAGPRTVYGDAVIRGIRCGAGIEGTCGNSTGIELVVRDAGFAPGSVRSAVNNLAGHKVSAIIALLPGSLAIEASTAATENEIPIFPISQKSGLMKQGSYVFQMGLTPDVQVSMLVKEAKRRGLKKIAIFYPNISYGRKMAQLFSQKFQAEGGKIAVEVSYDRGSKDPFADARKLKLKSITSVEKVGQYGFDAIFIPDSHQAANAMSLALEYNGIKGIPLIGTSTWNDPELSNRIPKNYPGSFFVDLYDQNYRASSVQSFKEKFRGSYGNTPQVLSALSYDAVMMIRSSVSRHGIKELKDSLTTDGFSGVTGIRGFRAGEGPMVEPRVISVKDYGFTE